MAFSRLKAASTAAAAPTTQAPAAAAPVAAAPVAATPAPAPVAASPVLVPAEAKVHVPTVETAVALAQPTNTMMTLFGNDVNMSAGLMAVCDVHDQGGGPAFPILTVAGGNAGGSFVPLSGTPQEIADMLPQGRKPVEGVFLAYRNEVTAWPISYQERQAQGGQSPEGSDKPCWSAVVPCMNADASRLLAEACQKYQYTKGVNKPLWNFAASGVGHIRPALQLLVYLPSVDDVIVVQTCSHYSSWKRSQDNLKRHVDPRTGSLTQFPCSIRSVTNQETIGPNQVSIHTLDLAAVMNDSGKSWWDAYVQWRTKLADAPDVQALLKEWIMGEDRPLNASILERLTKAKSIG